MKRPIDWGLYLVCDRQMAYPRSILEVVGQAVQGGVTVVQLREKDSPTREFLQLARQLVGYLRPRGIPLIINDRPDIALACAADGVHLGQSDLPCREARLLLGPEAIIGLSLENMGQLKEAESLDVDYLAVSPLFPTETKADTAPAWGLDRLRALRGVTGKTLIAIGGINRTNAEAAIAAGADGIAVVSAICAAPDPGGAARELKSLVERARGKTDRQI